MMQKNKSLYIVLTSEKMRFVGKILVITLKTRVVSKLYLVLFDKSPRLLDSYITLKFYLNFCLCWKVSCRNIYKNEEACTYSVLRNL